MSKPTVIGGKLRLKGSGPPKSSKVVTTSHVSTEAAEKKRKADSPEALDVKDSPSEVSKPLIPDEDSYLTASQRKHLEKKREIESRVIKTLNGKSFRERIDEFNSKLSVMTEHNDVPKVSAAGNG